jgi:hypothetical protein
MRDIEEILITQPSLERDTHELRHDARFRLFIWRYEVNPFCGPFGFHSSIDPAKREELLQAIAHGSVAASIETLYIPAAARFALVNLSPLQLQTLFDHTHNHGTK